jgi:phospholipid/cholesterol/gamma-HCH transport system substrate-binding protein
MQKAAPGLGRIAIMVGFALSVFGLLLFLWISFGGVVPFKPKGYRIEVAFPEAVALAQQADVRVAGVSVGKVVSKTLDPAGNRTLATLQIDNQYAPIRKDARAILRQKTLLGETYVELTTGHKGSPTIPEGGRLANAQVAPTVEFDEVLQAFDPAGRKAFRRWQQTIAQAGRGRGQDLNGALGNLPVFTEGATDVVEVLNHRRSALQSLVRNTGNVFADLTNNESALQQAIVKTREVFDTTASQRAALAEAFRIFPTFLDESKATLARLRTFSADTDPLVRDLGPVARDLQPTLRDLRALSPDLRSLFANLGPLISASKTGLPALQDVLRGLDPLLGSLGPFLSQLNPILQWLEQNQPAVSDFISVGGSATNYKLSTPHKGGNGHALPQLIMGGNQTAITPTRSSNNRGNSYFAPGGLADPIYKSKFIYRNWDCAPAGGERDPDTNPANPQPGCAVQGPIPFQGRTDRFPHVDADNYSR